MHDAFIGVRTVGKLVGGAFVWRRRRLGKATIDSRAGQGRAWPSLSQRFTARGEADFVLRTFASCQYKSTKMRCKRKEGRGMRFKRAYAMNHYLR